MTGLCTERLKSFACTRNLRNFYSVKSIHRHYFAPGKDAVIDDEFDRLIHSRIQFDHRSDSEFHDLFQNHFRLTETDRNRELYIQEKREVSSQLFSAFVLINRCVPCL